MPVSRNIALVLTRSLAIAALALTLSTVNAMADSLSGHVLDPQGRAVPRASIRLIDRSGSTLRAGISSAEGAYAFQGLPPGEYLVEATAASDALTMSQRILIFGNQTEDLRLVISGRSTTILVTASDAPQSVEEIGKAIDVVDSGQIALRDNFSIPEALRDLPGVRVKTLEGPGSTTTIKSRGLRTEDTAVLIDGIRFRDAASPKGDASAFLEDMVTADTDRIEFLRGSGSSLYGSHALGGVVNITSKSGGGSPHGQILSEGGGLGLFRNLFSIGGGVAEDRLTYSDTFSQLNTFRGVRKDTPYKNTSNQGTARYDIAPGMSVTGRLWYVHHHVTSTESPTFTSAVLANSPSTGEVRAIALPIDQLELFERGQTFNAGSATFIPNQIDPDGRRVGYFLSGGVTFDHRVTAGTTYRIVVQSVTTKRDYVDGPLGPGSFEPLTETESQINGYTTLVKAEAEQRAGPYNRVTFGYEFERERYDSFSGADYSATAPDSVELKQRSHAFYAQDRVSLADGRLQVTAAGRIQTFRLNEPTIGDPFHPYANVSALTPPTAYTGDGSIAYFFVQSGTKIRAHVGNSFRAPSAYERYGNYYFSGFYGYNGDPTLSPERAVAVDGGIDQNLYGSKVQVSATWFYTNLQQIIRYLNVLPAGDPFGRFDGYANGGGGIARGAEFSARFAPAARTRVETSYTFTNSESKSPTITGTNYTDVLGVSRHKFSAAVTQTVGRLTVAYD
ncbi:MAG TPA: TonB-dependent receptor, partial [Terriglobia bacterium]|nr:TonB-dependent receptor [Terriglobia bacterium]